MILRRLVSAKEGRGYESAELSRPALGHVVKVIPQSVFFVWRRWMGAGGGVITVRGGLKATYPFSS